MSRLRKIILAAAALSLIAGTAASSVSQVTASVATRPADARIFFNDETAVSELANLLSSRAQEAAQQVVDNFDIQAAFAEAEAAIPDTGDLSVDRESLLAEFVAAKLAPLLAKAVSDALADAITTAGVSPEVASAAMDIALMGGTNGSMASSVGGVVMAVVTNAFGSVFSRIGTDGLAGATYIINQQVTASVGQVRTVVQTAAAANPTSTTPTGSTRSTGSDRNNPPPITVIVVYRG